MSETVIDHPDYYNWIPGIECIDIIEHFGYNLGNIIKYIWRAGRKTANAREDLEKAMWYLQREINKEIQNEK